MSTEEPHAPSEAPAPPPAAATTAPAAEAAPAAPRLNRTTLLAIAVAVLAIIALVVIENRAALFGAPSADDYTVAAYTPSTEMIAAHERVEAREGPDATSPIVVVYGEGATINVTGRVARGIGNDWYAVSWRDRTAFVRQQDVVAGSGAPPAPIVREEKPDQEEEEEEPPFPEIPDQDDVVVAEAPTSTGTLDMSQVNWVREPSARDFARYYPTDALDRGQSGRVVLDCVIGGNGGLDCSVAQENPAGNGFGEAALNISRRVRVAPTLPDGSPASGRHMRLPLAFRAG
jgi:TonB family protein